MRRNGAAVLRETVGYEGVCFEKQMPCVILEISETLYVLPLVVCNVS